MHADREHRGERGAARIAEVTHSCVLLVLRGRLGFLRRELVDVGLGEEIGEIIVLRFVVDLVDAAEEFEQVVIGLGLASDRSRLHLARRPFVELEIVAVVRRSPARPTSASSSMSSTGLARRRLRSRGPDHMTTASTATAAAAPAGTYERHQCRAGCSSCASAAWRACVRRERVRPSRRAALSSRTSCVRFSNSVGSVMPCL